MYSVKHDESQKITDRSEYLAVLIEVWGLEVGQRWFCHQSQKPGVLTEKGMENKVTLNQVFFQMAGT